MPAPEPGPTLHEIHQARERIAGVTRHTPLEHSAWLSERAGHDVFMKLECWQRTRSFKLRGAANAVALLDSAQRSRGLVTASAGNHGQAVALAAREAGARATIFLPSNAVKTKKRRIRSFGAAINMDCADYDSAERAARAFAAETGATFVHAYSDRDVVAGQGTVGLEILADLPAVRNVIVPVGGGGLIAGVGMALKASQSSIRVIGVQTTRTCAMYDAFAAGRPVVSELGPTLADGLAGQVDELSYARARAVVDEMRLIPEAALPGAIRAMFGEGIIAEAAAATAFAAIAEGVVEVDGPTVTIITGGNIDMNVYSNLLASR